MVVKVTVVPAKTEELIGVAETAKVGACVLCAKNGITFTLVPAIV